MQTHPKQHILLLLAKINEEKTQLGCFQNSHLNEQLINSTKTKYMGLVFFCFSIHEIKRFIYFTDILPLSHNTERKMSKN